MGQHQLEAAQAAVARWAVAFNAGIGSDVAALYSPEAILWGTLAANLLTPPHAAHRYFTDALLSTLKVRLGEHSAIQLADGVVIDAGRYEFTLTKDGKVFRRATLSLW